MSQLQPSVQLAGGVIQRPGHVCAFFHSQEEEYDVLLPFAHEGFQSGEKNYQIVDPQHHSERLNRLQEAGVQSRGNGNECVEVRTWGDVYLRTGGFDQDDMLSLIQEVLRTGQQQGYPMTRLWANMEWALTDFPGVEDVVEYETRLNYVLPDYNDVVVCTYDLNRFRAGVVMDILRTHPMVIVGGLLQENPFYVPPDQFLKELRGRVRSRVERREPFIRVVAGVFRGQFFR